MTQIDATTLNESHHDHPAHLAHHFDTPGQQFQSGKLGIWLFLVTEILMFGGLFCAYAIYRKNNNDMFIVGSAFLNTNLGALNTVVLLLSSFSMAWSVRTAQLGKKTLTTVLLVLTLLGGLGFMTIKYYEYAHKLHLGVGPGVFFDPSEKLFLPQSSVGESGEKGTETLAQSKTPANVANVKNEEKTNIAPPATSPLGLSPLALNAQSDAHGSASHASESDHADAGGHHAPQFQKQRLMNARMFFNVYFMLTGLHGFHILVGMGLIAWILIKNVKGAFSPKYFTPVDFVGLYWHLVDLIWIFLFPLLYLIH